MAGQVGEKQRLQGFADTGAANVPAKPGRVGGKKVPSQAAVSGAGTPANPGTGYDDGNKAAQAKAVATNATALRANRFGSAAPSTAPKGGIDVAAVAEKIMAVGFNEGAIMLRKIIDDAYGQSAAQGRQDNGLFA